MKKAALTDFEDNVNVLVGRIKRLEELYEELLSYLKNVGIVRHELGKKG